VYIVCVYIVCVYIVCVYIVCVYIVCVYNWTLSVCTLSVCTLSVCTVYIVCVYIVCVYNRYFSFLLSQRDYKNTLVHLERSLTVPLLKIRLHANQGLSINHHSIRLIKLVFIRILQMYGCRAPNVQTFGMLTDF